MLASETAPENNLFYGASRGRAALLSNLPKYFSGHIKMMNKDKQTPGRIPIRFVDEDSAKSDDNGTSEQTSDNDLTPQEIGRASIYEDETEVQRRIDRGTEREDGKGRADDADTAGAPDPSDLPENREDLDTTPPSGGGDIKDASGGIVPDTGEPPETAHQAADIASGPVMAELVATRAELRRVEGELQKLTYERQDLVNTVARRQADFENYRKRVERERGESYNRIVGEVVGKLLPVVDNLRRALDAEAMMEAGESEEFRHFLSGIELISKQLNGVLEGLGVVPVETVGTPFDPHFHEAIATEASSEFAPDIVTAEIVRGYRLGAKLVRPAMVKVAK